MRFGFERGEHGDADAEDVHGVRGGGKLLERDLYALRKSAQAAEVLFVLDQLRLRVGRWP